MFINAMGKHSLSGHGMILTTPHIIFQRTINDHSKITIFGRNLKMGISIYINVSLSYKIVDLSKNVLIVVL
jgi:hypothetical protein